MPKYQSVNDSETVYPFLGLIVQPNEIVELPIEVDTAGLKPLSEPKVSKKQTQEQTTDVVESEGE